MPNQELQKPFSISELLCISLPSKYPWFTLHLIQCYLHNLNLPSSIFYGILWSLLTHLTFESSLITHLAWDQLVFCLWALLWWTHVVYGNICALLWNFPVSLLYVLNLPMSVFKLVCSSLLFCLGSLLLAKRKLKSLYPASDHTLAGVLLYNVDPWAPMFHWQSSLCLTPSAALVAQQ